MLDALQRVFVAGNGYPVDSITKRLLPTVWRELRDHIDRELDPKYPRPECNDNGITIPGLATITYNEIEGRFEVTL